MAKFYCKYGDRPPKHAIATKDCKTDASFEPECRIDRILYKYTHNLPLEQWQLRQSAGIYGDVSDIPHDPAELRAYMSALQERFDEMPAELRRMYHDDLSEYMVALSSNKDDAVIKSGKLMDEFLKVKNPTLLDIFEKSKQMYKQAIKEVEHEKMEAQQKAQ